MCTVLHEHRNRAIGSVGIYRDCYTRGVGVDRHRNRVKELKCSVVLVHNTHDDRDGWVLRIMMRGVSNTPSRKIQLSHLQVRKEINALTNDLLCHN